MGMMNAKVLKKSGYKPGDRVRVSTDTGPSLTKQEFREEADVNLIVKRFMSTGHLPDMKKVQGVFADVSGVCDLADMIRLGDSAKESFATLPAELRTRFHNDPLELLDCLQDPGFREEGIVLGLIEGTPSPKPAKPAAEPAKGDSK